MPTLFLQSSSTFNPDYLVFALIIAGIIVGLVVWGKKNQRLGRMIIVPACIIGFGTAGLLVGDLLVEGGSISVQGKAFGVLAAFAIIGAAFGCLCGVLIGRNPK